MTTDSRELHDLEDDGFHEIQLSGKQLVFLCMATTVVSIVIFLCGVLVGRGVRPPEPVAEASGVSAEQPTAPEPPAPAETPASSAAASPRPDSRTLKPPNPPAAPPPTPDTAPDRPTTGSSKETRQPSTAAPAPARARPAESAKPTPERTAPGAVASKPAPEPAVSGQAASQAEPSGPPKTTPSTTPAAQAKPAPAVAGGAIAVQVGAVRERVEAEALARRLSSKGYATYIVSPEAGASNPLFRVRVGNYTSPEEAARVKRRLEQEENLKPWIIR
jgi:SPOR domain